MSGTSQPQQVMIPLGGSISMPCVRQIRGATISSLPTNSGPVVVGGQTLVPSVPPLSGPCGANLSMTVWCEDLSGLVLQGASGDGVTYSVIT